MINRKLNLNELSVKSFITDLAGQKENTVRAGAIAKSNLMDCEYKAPPPTFGTCDSRAGRCK